MSQQDLSGTQVERYQVNHKLGQGGMAVVYLATDAALARQVVLKVMLPHLAHDASFVSRFEREARAMARLDHPNIIKVFNTGFTPNNAPYFSMQYVAGGTLTDRLRQLAQQQTRLPNDAVLHLIRQLADALAAAHDAGIVHRDIKPSNILLQPNGTPILTDLGIAAVQEDAKLTRTGVAIGTPHYMSPEQAAGKPVDGRSDIYSLGIVLYELLAGSVPFNAESSMAILHSHIYEPHPPLKNFHPGLKPITYQLVDKCLAKQPEARFQSARAFTAALDEAIQAEQGLTSGRAPGKQPVWLYPLIGLFVVLIAILGYFAFFGGSNGSSTADVEPTARTADDVIVVVVETAVPTNTPPTTNEADESSTQLISDDSVTSTAAPTVTQTHTATPTIPPTNTPTPLPPTETPTTAPIVCDGASPTRLEIGEKAVTINFQLNVRAGAGESFVIVDRLAIGREVTIIGGPVCNDRQLWYQILSDPFTNSSGERIEVEGWSVEESGDVYFMEPLN